MGAELERSATQVRAMPLIRAESMMDLRDDTAYGGCSRFCMMQCGGCCCIGLGVIMIAIGSLMPVMVGALIDGNAARAVVLESTTDDLGAPSACLPSSVSVLPRAWR